MSFQFESDDDQNFMTEINIVPLVDIMLVLLVIFMVTAPLSISGVSVDLPKTAQHSMKVQNKRLVVSIDPKGEYFLEQTNIPASKIENKLSGIFKNRKEKTLYIRADEKVAYGKVIQLMSLAKLSGAVKISMLTEVNTKL